MVLIKRISFLQQRKESCLFFRTEKYLFFLQRFSNSLALILPFLDNLVLIFFNSNFLLVGTFCATDGLGVSLTSSGNTLLLNFVTDASLGERGIKINWESISKISLQQPTGKNSFLLIKIMPF